MVYTLLMTTKEMLTLARELVAKHLDRDVPVVLGRGVRTLGSYYSRRTFTGTILHEEIRLSKYLVEIPREQVIDVILHEIAHVIAGHEAGHGPKWKAACIKVGANPRRLYEEKEFGMVVAKKANNYAHCPCGKFHNRPIFRLSKQWKTPGYYHCPKCKKALTVTSYQLDGKFHGEVAY